jgi:signal transduction histidine kinase
MPAAPAANILIVDDDLGLLRLLERTLKRQGYLTATAGSGKVAIEWLAKNKADLMLVDLKLQDIEGKELINHLEGIGRRVPFIIITGQGDERVAVEMMKRGALDYLVKDVKFIEFLPIVVNRVLAQLEKDKQLAAAQTALKESQEQLLAISEREQARFGAELHDGLGQQLTAIELRCQAMKEDFKSSETHLIKQLSEISQFLREAVAHTRSLARGLSPVCLGSSGLTEALGELASRMSMGGKIKCSFDSSSPVLVDDNNAAGHLYRIAQEAVNNAVKHSGASEVILQLTKDNGAVHLVISDNGKGLPKSPKAGQGIGLQIMKHRASVIGAELEIKSRTGKGVTVTCTLKNGK